MMMLDSTGGNGPSFEHEVRKRLGITAQDFLARLKFNELEEFNTEDVAYLINIGKDKHIVPNE